MSTAQINSGVCLALVLSLLMHGFFFVTLVPAAELQQTKLSTISVSLVRPASKGFVMPAKAGIQSRTTEKIRNLREAIAALPEARLPLRVGIALDASFRWHDNDVSPSDAPSYPQPPSPNQIVEPAYTHRALRARIEGEVVLDVLIGTDGRVASAQITKSLGYGLDENALEAMLRCTFVPARTPTGEAIDERIIYRFRFEIPSSIASSIAH